MQHLKTTSSPKFDYASTVANRQYVNRTINATVEISPNQPSSHIRTIRLATILMLGWYGFRIWQAHLMPGSDWYLLPSLGHLASFACLASWQIKGFPGGAL